MELQVIMPIGAMGASEHDDALDTLMRKIALKYDPDAEGSWAEKYGANFQNDAFEMRRFYWDDCECGYQDKEDEWHWKNQHGEDCYQSLLKKAEREAGLDYWEYDTEGNYKNHKGSKKLSYDETKAIQKKLYAELMAKFSLPEFGCAVHCTCQREIDRKAWGKENEHDPKCRIVAPNFKHYATGLEVRWYKYIGRGMETNVPFTKELWEKITCDLLAE